MPSIKNEYKYFMYSDDQFKERNNVLKKTGKEFQPGIVVVNGKRKEFTQMTDVPKIPRFFDSKIVAKGYLNQITYELPKNVKRKGNNQ